MLTTEVSADSWGRIIDFSADVDGRFGLHGHGVYWQYAASNALPMWPKPAINVC